MEVYYVGDLVDKFPRKVTKSNRNARQINVPRSVQSIIGVSDVTEQILKDEKTKAS